MSAESPTSPPRPRRSRLRRFAVLIVTTVIVVLIGAWTMTTNAFLQSVVLPRIAERLDLGLSASHIEFHPFSSLRIADLVVHSDTAPVATLQGITVRFRPGALLGPLPTIDEIVLDTPTIHAEALADIAHPSPPPTADTGTRSVPPALTTNAPSPFRLNRLEIRNGSLSYTSRETNNPLSGGFTNLNLKLENLGPDQAASLEVQGSAYARSGPATAPDLLRTATRGHVTFQLTRDYLPQSIEGEVNHALVLATGRFAPLQGLTLQGRSHYATNHLLESVLRVLRQEDVLAELRASGPANPLTRELNLRIELGPVAPDSLRLLTQPWGIDLGQPTLQALLQVETSRQGTLCNVSGRSSARGIALTTPHGPTPTLDFSLGFSLTLDTENRLARLNTFLVDAQQDNRPTLQGALNQPLLFDWNNGKIGPRESALALSLNRIDLTPWAALADMPSLQGVLAATLTLQPDTVSQGLHATLSGSLQKLDAPLGTTARLAADSLFDLQASLGPDQPTDYRGSLEFARATIRDPSARHSGRPFDTRLSFAGQWSGGTGRIDRADWFLPATSRTPTNRLSLTGTFSHSPTDSPSFALALSSDLLELDPLQDAWPPKADQDAAASPGPTAAPEPMPNPEPATWPIAPSFLTLKVERLLYREMEVGQAEARLDIGPQSLHLQPCGFQLNGAPASLQLGLDTSRPGWDYTLALQARDIPLPSLLLISPPSARDRYTGTLHADLALQGAGFTPADLQNLAGHATLTLTNGQVQLLSDAARQLLTPIASLLQIREIDRSPLTWLHLQTDITNGTLSIAPIAIQTDAFEAHAQGTLTLALDPRLTQLHIPIDFRLRRSLAAKANLLPPNTPADAAYVQLPPFITLAGTFDKPKTDLDSRILSGVLLRSGLGIAERLGVEVNPQTGTLLNTVGNILSGTPPAGTTTNAPPQLNTLTNLIDLLRPR